ncbi:MAG: GGDEF domain-containing protein [Sphaerobacteraceae bacterium]|nr:MAG: GGDEF domain-containing protein [Sphaerobacteraceae bacterium]
MEPRSHIERTSIILALISSIGLVAFAAIWELRWSRLVSTLTRRQQTADEWVERALHDPLTNLPNRSLLNDRIEQALIRSQRNGTSVAVLFIDLDNFKAVNDRYGHLIGDQLLIAAGERLRQHLRASDTAGRMGGDEFVVLLEIRDQNDPVKMVADRLRRALHVPLLLEPAPITLGASIGVAISTGTGDRVEELLDRADSALLQAKHAGKDQVVMAPVTPAAEREETQISQHLSH